MVCPFRKNTEEIRTEEVTDSVTKHTLKVNEDFSACYGEFCPCYVPKQTWGQLEVLAHCNFNKTVK
jgi:hypothetical protein